MQVDIEVDHGRLRVRLDPPAIQTVLDYPRDRSLGVVHEYIPDIEIGPGWFDSSRALLTGLEVSEAEVEGRPADREDEAPRPRAPMGRCRPPD